MKRRGKKSITERKYDIDTCMTYEVYFACNEPFASIFELCKISIMDCLTNDDVFIESLSFSTLKMSREMEFFVVVVVLGCCGY